MSSSAASRYRKAVLAVDEYLRKSAPDGTRIRVHYREVAQHVNANMSTISGAMIALSNIKGSGLVPFKDKGQRGTYEFCIPVDYPEELAELKAELRTSHTPARIIGNVRQDVIKYFKKNPNEIQTVTDVHEAVGGNRASVTNAMRALGNTGWIEPRPDISQGAYIYHTNEFDDPELSVPLEQSTTVPDVIKGLETSRPKSVKAEDHLPKPVPTPATSAIPKRLGTALKDNEVIIPVEELEKVNDEVTRLREELAKYKNQTGSNEEYPPDAQLYEWVWKTKDKKEVLRNRDTQALGYWEPM